MKTMDTAPKDRDILLFCLLKPWEGSCPFKGFVVGGYDREGGVWSAIGYNDRGLPMHVVPFGWEDLPEVSSAMDTACESFTEEEFDKATNTVYTQLLRNG